MKQLLPKQIRKINLLTKKKYIYRNTINNSLNKSNLIKTQDDLFLKGKIGLLYNNKTSPKDSAFNKRIYTKGFFKNSNKYNDLEIIAKNKRKINNPKNFTCDISNSKYMRYSSKSREMNHEQSNESKTKKVMITNAIYDDAKLRNIINLWNELEVLDSYRNYFIFIYNELDEEEQKDLYLTEINELVQLKNDIKNLTYNIELRIGIIKILSELNTELN